MQAPGAGADTGADSPAPAVYITYVQDITYVFSLLYSPLAPFFFLLSSAPLSPLRRRVASFAYARLGVCVCVCLYMRH